FLAEVGHGPGSNAEGQITKVEPCHAGPEPEKNQEAGDDHQTHAPSVLRHCFPPSMSSRHGGTRPMAQYITVCRASTRPEELSISSPWQGQSHEHRHASVRYIAVYQDKECSMLRSSFFVCMTIRHAVELCTQREKLWSIRSIKSTISCGPILST